MFYRLLSTILNPGLLEGFDRHLLLHYPTLWSTKLHYVTYYTFIENFILFIFIIFTPIEYYYYGNNYLVIFTVDSISFILLIYWIYKQYIFRFRNKYIGVYKLKGIQEITIYIIGIIFLMSHLITIDIASKLKLHFYDFDGKELSIDSGILNFLLNLVPENSEKYLQDGLPLIEKYKGKQKKYEMPPEKLEELLKVKKSMDIFLYDMKQAYIRVMALENLAGFAYSG